MALLGIGMQEKHVDVDRPLGLGPIPGCGLLRELDLLPLRQVDKLRSPIMYDFSSAGIEREYQQLAMIIGFGMDDYGGIRTGLGSRAKWLLLFLSHYSDGDSPEGFLFVNRRRPRRRKYPCERYGDYTAFYPSHDR
jgi:hypothetical protein